MITEITNDKYGNAYITDETTGESFYLYGAYVGGENIKKTGDTFSVTKDSTKLIDSSYVGKRVTAAGTMYYYKNTAEFSPAAILTSSTDKVDAKVTVAETTNGTVTLDKESFVTENVSSVF